MRTVTSIDGNGAVTVEDFPAKPQAAMVRAEVLYGYASLNPLLGISVPEVQPRFDPVAAADALVAQYVHEITSKVGM